MNASITYGDHLDGNQEGARLYGIEYSTSGYGLRGHFQSLDNYEVLDVSWYTKSCLSDFLFVCTGTMCCL